ncbi:class D beta-lactamase [Gelidibacter mesophilus]|uniref:class D beta-lactamase n=1 Tax=Gelidibacter mesophilus TaxID=169050 RepID=UPI000488FC63|nr:class D beta-lactamase [Gelidibacter mesophilus]
MRLTTLIVLLALLISCKEKQEAEPLNIDNSVKTHILKPELQAILDSSKVAGSILIYDLNEDRYYSNDFKWASMGHLPASTFKIPNSIIGVETGVIESDSTIFKWDGEKKWSKNWEQDLVLKNAFQWSCVPCYQEVAREIGVKRMNNYVDKLNYGNLTIDALHIDTFWLVGQSRISQMQQIDFLKRLYNSELPIAGRTEKIMKHIMRIEETDQYKLSGKTGLSNENGHYNGWFVGYIEIKSTTYIFATNLEPQEEFDVDLFIKQRSDLTLLAFKRLNLLK